MNKVITENGISGNSIGAISDHLGKFLILPYHSIIANPNTETFKRNPKKFSKNNFLSDLTKMGKTFFSIYARCQFIL